MKKIRIFATALLLAFTLSSCESFFDVELDDQAKICLLYTSDAADE